MDNDLQGEGDTLFSLNATIGYNAKVLRGSRPI